MDTVAYIVVCWNNQDLLDECLKSIQGQDYKNKKIIVVDNASADTSVQFIKDNFPEVEVLEQAVNHAFAKGNNIGIAHALKDDSVKYIALINSDATLDAWWTDTLISFAEKKTRVAALQTITLDYFDHSTIDSTHIYISHNGQATQASWRRPILPGTDVAPQKVFGCNAAAVIFTRDFIEKQPFKTFFDETMWMYLEDVDVATRATVMGWDNYTVPGARAYHMGSASSSKNPGFSLYYTFRNNIGLLVKNLPLIIIIRLLPKLIRGDIDTLKVLWRTGRKDSVKYVVKGRVVGLLRLPLFIVKRPRVKRTMDTMELWRLMLRGF